MRGILVQVIKILKVIDVVKYIKKLHNFNYVISTNKDSKKQNI